MKTIFLFLIMCATITTCSLLDKNEVVKKTLVDKANKIYEAVVK